MNGIFSFTYDRPFVLFSPSHLLTLLVVVAVWVAVSVNGAAAAPCSRR